jgi:hypothetical protein
MTAAAHAEYIFRVDAGEELGKTAFLIVNIEAKTAPGKDLGIPGRAALGPRESGRVRVGETGIGYRGEARLGSAAAGVLRPSRPVPHGKPGQLPACDIRCVPAHKPARAGTIQCHL